MSDAFVSGTRRAPYRTGFRARQLRGNLPIAIANKLNDRDFTRYRQNGYRFPDPEQDLRDQLAEQREAIRVQALQVNQLQEAARRNQLQLERLLSLLPKAMQASVSSSSAEGAGVNSLRGLDVARRA